MAKKARAVTAGLFPLPLQPLLKMDGRRRSAYVRRRWGEAQATRALALLSGLALNWEATGRPHAPEARQYRANEAQLRAVARLRAAEAEATERRCAMPLDPFNQIIYGGR